MVKHLFIINPTAGKSDASALLMQQIEALSPASDCSYAVTQAPGHARTLVKKPEILILDDPLSGVDHRS